MGKPNSLLRRVLYAVFFGVGGAMISRVFMALASVVLANLLGQENFGKFSSVHDTINLFVTFSGVGVSATLTRYIAANRQSPELQGVFVRTLSKACMAMSLVLSLAMLVFAPQISRLTCATDELAGYFRLVAVAVFFAAMAAVEQSVMLGFERFAASSFMQLVQCSLYCLLCWLLSRPWGINGAVWALVISYGVQLLLSCISNHIYLKKNNIPLRWRWDSLTKQAMVGFALPTFAAGLFVLPVNWIGTAILNRTAGFGEKAVFTIALQWMTYITYVPSQLGQMRPIYTDLYAKGEAKRLKKLLFTTILLTTAAAAVIGGGVMLFKNAILGIYGAGFLRGGLTLGFMIGAAVLYTAQVQTGFLLQASGRMWIGLAINAFWAACLLGTYLCLTHLGSLGYAIGYRVAYGVTLTLQLAVVLRELRRMHTNTDTQGESHEESNAGVRHTA